MSMKHTRNYNSKHNGYICRLLTVHVSCVFQDVDVFCTAQLKWRCDCLGVLFTCPSTLLPDSWIANTCVKLNNVCDIHQYWPKNYKWKSVVPANEVWSLLAISTCVKWAPLFEVPSYFTVRSFFPCRQLATWPLAKTFISLANFRWIAADGSGSENSWWDTVWTTVCITSPTLDSATPKILVENMQTTHNPLCHHWLKL